MDTTNGSTSGKHLQSTATRIVVADSQEIYGVGVCRILSQEKDLHVISLIHSLDQLSAHPADIVLLDADLYAAHTKFVAEARSAMPDTKFIILQSAGTSENQIVELYRNGVRGVIPRNITPDLLVRCIRRIAAGEIWINNQSVDWVVQAYRAQTEQPTNSHIRPGLSAKETAIVVGITQGKRNKEIALQLKTTEQVIKNCLRKIYDKLGVNDRLGLALYCMNNNVNLPDTAQESYMEVAVN